MLHLSAKLTTGSSPRPARFTKRNTEPWTGVRVEQHRGGFRQCSLCVT